MLLHAPSPLGTEWRGFSCCRTLEGWLAHSYILLSGGIWRQVWCSALPIIVPFSAVCTVAAFGAQQNESWAFAQGNAWSLKDVLQQLQHPLLRPGCGTVANVVMCWNAVAPPAWIQAKQCTESKTCHGISSNNFQNFTGCYMVLFFYLILCLRECREWVESTDLFQKSQLLPYTRLHVLLHMSQSQMPAGLNCQ